MENVACEMGTKGSDGSGTKTSSPKGPGGKWGEQMVPPIGGNVEKFFHSLNCKY